MPGASAAVIARLNQRFYALCIAHGIIPPIGMAEQPESEPNMIAPSTDSSAPTKRPATLAEFLERYPLPWKPYRIDSLSGAEWEIEAANGDLVPNHGGTFCVEEYARVFSELGNELGRLRRANVLMRVALKEIDGHAPAEEPEYDDWGGDTERAEVWGQESAWWDAGEIARRALAGAAAPAAE